jgi:RNA polymerase sigma-70 factor, ECF subfamily
MTDVTDSNEPAEPGADLIAAAVAGDLAAREALLRFGLPTLRGYLTRRMGPFLRSLETSADLAQSVCGEVLQDLPEFEDRGSAGFRRWLLVRAENKILKRFRFHTQEKRDAGRVDPLSESMSDRVGAPRDVSPSDQAIANEEWERMRAALDALPPDYREVIVLSRIVGLAPDQVAERMGRSREAVWSLLSRALARLAMAAEPRE